MKRRIAVIGIVIAVLALAAVGSYAYYTHEDTARNAITTGGIAFRICETTKTGEEFPIDGITVLPGDTVSKIVKGKNTGDHPLYLRVKLTLGVNDNSLTVGDRITMDLNTTDWTYQDGYYYYNTALTPNEETAPLFTEVYVDGASVGNEYIGKVFTLDIDGQAVQSENNGDGALTAIGWPEDN